MKQKIQKHKIERIKNLLPQIVVDKSHILSHRESLIIWMRDTSPFSLTWTEIDRIFSVCDGKSRRLYTRAKLALTRGYRHKYRSQCLFNNTIDPGNLESGFTKNNLAPKTLRQKFGEALDKDIAIFKAIVARFNSY